MKAEIIAVGTELLLGQIVNSNAQFLSQQLAEIGVNVYFQTVVGDNAERMEQAIRLASERADLIICTGGLGPTQDDITKDVLAKIIEKELVFDPDALARIRAFYEGRSIEMPENNARQATLIAGAQPLPNDNGMAVGAAWMHEGTRYIVLPGPPRELKLMFTQYARPWIITQLDDSRPLFSTMLRFAGIGESNLEKELADLIATQQNVTIAPYANEGEVTVRLTVRSETRAEADQAMQITLQEIRQRVGQYLYAEDAISLEEAVMKQYSNLGLTIAVAESCTGGLLAQYLTSVPGSSATFVGGVVSYSSEMKQNLLQIEEEIFRGKEAPGAISKQCAAAMAQNIRKLVGSHVGVSITGVAGPSMIEGKPVGLVYTAITDENGTEVYESRFNGDREVIRMRAAKHALYRLWKRASIRS